MKDMNFFELQKKDNKRRRFLNIALYIVLITAIIFGLRYIDTNYLRLDEREESVELLRSKAEEISLIKSVEEIKIKQSELSEIKDDIKRFQEIDDKLTSNELLVSNFFEEINKIMPETLFLTSINYRDRNFELQGFSGDSWSVARFQKSIYELGIFEEVFINSIKHDKDKGIYQFFISIS